MLFFKYLQMKFPSSNEPVTINDHCYASDPMNAPSVTSSEVPFVTSDEAANDHAYATSPYRLKRKLSEAKEEIKNLRKDLRKEQRPPLKQFWLT